jgi:hypothetical protein
LMALLQEGQQLRVAMRSPSTRGFYSRCAGPVIQEADSAGPSGLSVNQDLALGT